MTFEEIKQKAEKKQGEKDRVFKLAHDCSFENKEQLAKSELCGCFWCCRIFHASEVTDYVSVDEPTALCPYCSTDSVIGDASGFPITKEFLREMRKRWF